MELDETECWSRLRAAPHGVLGTVHPERGVDAVPTVFALDEGRLVLPIDAVKPKRGGRLRRLRNLELDPRCVLLVDHHDDDWSRLWWVRVHGRAGEAPVTERHLELLGRRYPAYRSPGTVTGVVVLTPSAVTGWTAGS